MKFIGEKGVQRLLLIVALSAISALLLIALFIFIEGLPFIFKYGLKDFLFSSDWNPQTGKFGIFAMIAASFWVTLGAMLIGAPLGIAGAVFLSEFVPVPVMRIIKPAIELLAAIPSVIYGFIGVMVLAPLIRNLMGGPGLSVLAGAIILGIMILPTIISISTDSLISVPQSYRDGSLALGATTWQTTYMLTIKAAKSGIIASIILGMGRAIGETMAVIMVTGNSVMIPHSALDSVRTLTANIALEMSYATGIHREALFATGVVLFIIIIFLNSIASVAIRKKVFSK
jgi:phosphate ABC transporter permease protein PstC